MLVNYAKITYTDTEIKSQDYEDIYFYPQQGFAESDYVFIQGNNLEQRFKNLAGGDFFTIGELGFGTGLNFLLTADLFLKTAPKNARLIFISCEKAPIKLEQLQEIQKSWDLPLKNQLYQNYPKNYAGFHLLSLNSQIDLLLLFGEGKECLKELNASIDAWFLDGFAPSKNPDFWTEEIFLELAKKSQRQTTLATYSAASQVRQNLEKVGFEVFKATGFMNKREMIKAVFKGEKQKTEFWTDFPKPITKAKKIAIIGAGLAGATTANALARRGYAIDIFNSPNHKRASLIPYGIPHFQPSLEDNALRNYHLSAFLLSNRRLRELNQKQELWQQEPITLKAETEQKAQKFKKLYQQNFMAEEDLKISAEGDLIFYGSGVIDTPKLLEVLLNEPQINLIEKEIKDLEELKDYGAIILATGFNQTLLPKEWQGTLQPLRGQAAIFNLLNKEFKPQILCTQHSIFPAPQNKVYVGSIYEPDDVFEEVREEEREILAKIFKEAYPDEEISPNFDFAALRATVRDYFPLLGAIPNAEDLINKYYLWAKDKNLKINTALNFTELPCFINAGLGSKGLLISFLNAELIASMISAEALPLEQKYLKNLLPARILLYKIIHNKI